MARLGADGVWEPPRQRGGSGARFGWRAPSRRLGCQMGGSRVRDRPREARPVHPYPCGDGMPPIDGPRSTKTGQKRRTRCLSVPGSSGMVPSRAGRNVHHRSVGAGPWHRGQRISRAAGHRRPCMRREGGIPPAIEAEPLHRRRGLRAVEVPRNAWGPCRAGRIFEPDACRAC